jgi:hypothetical protein
MFVRSFVRIEAVETAIWLTEVAPQWGKTGKRFLEHLADANNGANPELMRLALKLATGAGKTTVMAMIIAWQTINAIRQPGSIRFTRGFLVVTPGAGFTGPRPRAKIDRISPAVAGRCVPPPLRRRFAGSSVMEAPRWAATPDGFAAIPIWPRTPRNAPVPPVITKLLPAVAVKGARGGAEPPANPFVTIVPNRFRNPGYRMRPDRLTIATDKSQAQQISYKSHKQLTNSLEYPNREVCLLRGE